MKKCHWKMRTLEMTLTLVQLVHFFMFSPKWKIEVLSLVTISFIISNLWKFWYYFLFHQVHPMKCTCIKGNMFLFLNKLKSIAWFYAFLYKKLQYGQQPLNQLRIQKNFTQHPMHHKIFFNFSLTLVLKQIESLISVQKPIPKLKLCSNLVLINRN
jgi:hypothetical protein